MTVLLLLLVLTVAQTPPRLKGLDVLGSGINPLTGNMDPFSATDYIDMFRYPVFNVSWSQGLTTRDGLWSIPDNTTADLLEVCSFTQITVQVTCSLDYQEWASFYMDADYDVMFFFSTSLSISYSEYVKITTSMSNYAYVGDSVCTYYKIGYTPDTSELLSDYFAKDVSTLPTEYKSLNDYQTFFNNYGTHVLTSMDMGGRFYQSTQVSSFNFSYLESQSIDVEKEASIGFLSSAGMDVSGQASEKEYVTFSKYSQKGVLECLGGNAALCGNWSQWAVTVDGNPVPVKVTLRLIYTLLTPTYFPNDPLILARQLALAEATKDYLTVTQKVPEQYLADVSEQSGIANHRTSIKQSTQGIPTYVAVQFTSMPDRTNLSASKYFMTDFAYDEGNSGNFRGIELSYTAITLSIDGSDLLFGGYDGSSNQWTSYKSGFWSAVFLSQKPALGGDWVYKSSNVQEAVILLNNVDANAITLFQAQFATAPNPTIAYPLIWRAATSNGTTGCRNPVSIRIEYGQVTLQFSGGTNVFAVWNNDNGTWQWTDFQKEGYFRANIFTIGADYNSGWVPAISTRNKQAIFHGLGVIPELVQVFFSPDTTGAKVYPVTWNYYPGQTPNPTGIYADQNNVYISVISTNNRLWGTWAAANSTWTYYTAGYWKVTAWRKSPEATN